jgi:NAD-dependent deacetylase
MVWDTEEVLGWVEAGDPDPACPDCAGMVKTATVMFGELLPESELAKAMTFLAMADAMLVVGSTVAVWPASDIVMRGAFRSLPIVVINRGETEVDHLAAVKLDAGIGETLPEIVDGLLAG